MPSFTCLRSPLARNLVVVLFLGIASGLPLLLVFGTLSVWLREAGIERATIGFLSWAALSYSFKFIWAPLVDSLPIPWLTKRLGRRRSWMLISQALVVLALLVITTTDPAYDRSNLIVLTIGAILLAFASATQDIVIDAYRIDIAPPKHQPLLAQTAMAGYRLGMIVAGAGALEISDSFDDNHYNVLGWQIAYTVMAVIMVLAMLITLAIREPKHPVTRVDNQFTASHVAIVAHYLVMAITFVAVFIGYKSLFPLPTPPWSAGATGLLAFVYEAVRLLMAMTMAILMGYYLTRLRVISRMDFAQIYIKPFKDFFQRYGSMTIWLLLLIAFYRIADIVMGVMAKIFYTDMGYSKVTIGRVSFAFGLFVTIIGGVLGGILALYWGILRMLLLGAILAAGSNLVFVYLHNLPEPSITALTCAIIADNLAGGLASAVAVAFLSSLVNRKFSATQYATFSSITLLAPKLIAGYSGQIVDAIDYSAFFILTAAMGIPVIFLILKIWKNYQSLPIAK